MGNILQKNWSLKLYIMINVNQDHRNTRYNAYPFSAIISLSFRFFLNSYTSFHHMETEFGIMGQITKSYI